MKTMRLVPLLAALVAVSPAPALETKGSAAENTVISLLGRALARIEEVFPSYLKRQGSEPLFLAALNGLLREVDPSGGSYGFRRGRASGPGQALPPVTIRLVEGVPTITGVVVPSEAFLKDVRQGDILMRIDDRLVLGQDIGSIQGALLGASGSPVKLGMFRRQGNTFREATLKREAPGPVVSVRTIKPSLGYVRLSTVEERVVGELEGKIASLARGKLTGIVLDLRNTAGGSPELAARLVSALSPGPEKVVCKVVTAQGSRSIQTAPRPGALKVPIVAVVNQGTSGAAEIAAAALQENRRAIVLGERTLGQPAWETDSDISADVGVRLASALVQTPSGRDLTAQGVKPDIEQPEEPVSAGSIARLREEFSAMLRGVKPQPVSAKATGATTEAAPQAAHAPNEDEDEERGADPDKPKDAEGSFDEYPLVRRFDAQLMRAVNLLVGTSIIYEQILSND